MYELKNVNHFGSSENVAVANVIHTGIKTAHLTEFPHPKKHSYISLFVLKTQEKILFGEEMYSATRI